MNKEDLEKITEAVVSGIVASKKSESNFWGEVKAHMEKTNDHLGRIEEHLGTLNHRTDKHADAILNIRLWRSWMTGGLMVVGVIIPLAVYFITGK